MKKALLTIVLVIGFLKIEAQPYNWSNLPNAPYNGSKQDGIFFLNQNLGWSVNGSGRIFKTQDGGVTWLQQKNAPGTYFRSVAFVNDQVGFAGNIGINYFPGVTDTNPLYKTIDGGNSWAPVTASITGVVPAGICAIEAVNENVIYAAGRVGTPQVILKSTDGGNTWTGTDISSQCKMILDLHFQTPEIGYAFTGTSASIASSKARVLRTTDGGTTWSIVYTSTRNYEIMWKASFPTANVGYASIQSYNSATTQRYIIKTIDGGLTWSELSLTNSGAREFGIGFISDNVGWVGGETTGYETVDGGLTWTEKNIGQYANKFSVTANPNGSKTVYAIGLNVFKMTDNGTLGTTTTSIHLKNDLLVSPNPAVAGQYIAISLDKIKTKIVKSELISIEGKATTILFDAFYTGTQEAPFMFKLPNVASGNYILKFTDENGKIFKQKIAIIN
ncbi:YCF48-related protein [Flavobacterium sp.]|uniref:WD40/YVTN/BNR-like repeat-containing protein n=1 Tax=Flavobacterium sp. TaxID=239 RepID=UPI00286BD4E0|nr:YCF48-related protein [Flavobacterium sp.]